MQVEAKVASGEQPVNSAPSQTVTDRIAIQPGDTVALNVAPESVTGFSRDGTDLVVTLQDGQTLRVVNFYGDPQKPSHLYLVDEDQELLRADLVQASDGSFTSSYVPLGVAGGFEGLAVGGPAAAFPLAAILGGAAGAGGLAAAAAGGGGDDNGGGTTPPPPTPDTTAPVAASNLAISANGATLTGNAEAGATVGVDTNRDGTIDRTVVAGANGQFQITLDPPFTNGETVNVFVTDPAGNRSPSASVTALDTTAPDAATGVAVSTDGTTVSGAAQPGTTVRVDTNGDGTPDATGTAGNDGRFTIPLTPPLTDGQTVTVVVADAAGNTSTPVNATAPDTTAPAPATGVTVAPDGTGVTGSAQPGTTVSVDTNGDGVPDATGTTGPGGGFTIPLDPPLTNGETVTVVVSDPTGNDSTPVNATAPDSTAPAAADDLVISADGTALTGTAEPGATVSVDTDGDGTPDQSTTVDADGTFEIILDTPLINGEVAVVVVTDGAGNDSPAAPAFAPDLFPTPGAPTVSPTNGNAITGTAVPGTTVQVSDFAGNPIGSAITAPDGSFTIAPASPPADGTVLSVVAVNGAGEAGPATSVIVDAAAPAAPILSPTNGDQIVGTAEAGSTVTVTNGAGTVIGTDIADAAGNFSVTPTAALADGEVVSATARDAAGNTSVPGTVVIESSLLAIPTVEATNGTVIEGTADAFNTVIITDAAGNAIGTTTADLSGNYSFTPATQLADGTVVRVQAQDLSGTRSAFASTIVDAAPPAVPIVEAGNGTDITGTAEAGATITLTDGAGAPIGTTTADANGDWSFTPGAQLADGTVVNVTAADAVGNVSGPATDTVDAAAPAAPLILPSNGVEFAGTAEAGSTITLTDGAGAPIGTTTTDANGNWTFTPATQVADGTTVNATATDAAGNSSAPAGIIVDGSLPSIPQLEPSNGSVIEGIADPGALVTLNDDAGNPIGTVTAGADGSFSFTPATQLPDGTVVRAVAENVLGTDSAPATLIIDGVAPGVPTIEAGNGTEITGTAEAGALITLTDADTGGTIGFAIAQPDGSFSFTPSTPLANNVVVSALATDAAGNVGPAATDIVDALAPGAPIITPTNGDDISGTAEAGATITLTTGAGVPIGTTTADAGGAWSFTPAEPLADGTVIRAVASDAAGNDSASATTTVDALPPGAPFVAPSNGDLLVGTAEPGSTITLTDDAGTPIGTTVTDADGNWEFAPAAPIADGTVVSATATDPAGNVSGPGTVTIDATLPSVPVLEPTNGTVIEGVADAGNLVTIADNLGNPIGTVTAGADGSFSLTPTPSLPDGTVVVAVATDGFGVNSGPATVTVDAIAPAAPTIEPTDGTVLTGTAEAGALVTLSDGAGAPIATVTAAADGSYSVTPAVPLADDTVVNAVATDASGNASPAATTIVDSEPPAAPTIFATNGEVLAGTAEPGALITLTTAAGLLGTTVADGAGNWDFTPATPLADDVVVTAIASDAVGNDSGSATVIVDASLPSIPVLNATDGTVITGIADAGNLVTVTDAAGNLIGTATAGADGSFSVTPAGALPDGTVVEAVATNPLGTDSAPGTITVDAVAPLPPTIDATNGELLTGTAEAGALVTFTDGAGNAIGQVVATNGTYSFAPAAPLVDGTVVNAVASDAAGNDSPAVTTTVDALAPAAPANLVISGDGTLLTGTAETGSQVAVVVDGDTSNPIIVTAVGGTFSVPFSPPLDDGEVVTVTATDAVGNESLPGTAFAPDLSAPLLSVPEAADGYLNAQELTDGIQTLVDISPSVRAGDTVNVTFSGQNGYVVTATQVVTAADVAAGFVGVTVSPAAGQAAFPEGASSLTARVNAGDVSAPVTTTVDTTPPAAPALSLVGNILTVSAEPGTELDVVVNVTGLVATVTVTADNNGLASLDLLTDLDIDLQLDQLLDSSISVTGTDVAGNTSNVATVSLADQLAQPVTIGDLALAVALFPTPTLGLRGTAENGSSVRVDVTTPVANVTINPPVDANGNFVINLLDTNVLLGLGLSITQLLNLSQPISVSIVATDEFGNDSARTSVSLGGSGLSLNLGAITVTGTAGDDIIYGNASETETINALAGDDLVLDVGSGDTVNAGDGNDVIGIDAINFTRIDGGTGFDTLLLSDGIDFDYNGAGGVGVLANIERINLGTGDSGSTLTLLPTEVDIITDADNILQITGDANDTLVATGATLQAAQQTIDGVVFDVYTFGNTTLLVEDNAVQVVV